MGEKPRLVRLFARSALECGGSATAFQIGTSTLGIAVGFGVRVACHRFGLSVKLGKLMPII